MAKKTRKQKQRAATRRPGAPAPGAVTRQATAAAPASQRQAPATPRVAQPQILPETVLPLPSSEVDIEFEPTEDDEQAMQTVAAATESASRRRVQRVNPAAQPRARGAR